MRKLLDGFGESAHSVSWWVGYQLSRPLVEPRRLPKIVRRALTAFLAAPPDGSEPVELEPMEGIRLVLTPTAKKERVFILASSIDHARGGWLGSILQANIQRCIEEKATKIRGKQSLYDRWWLVLVDHIGYALSELDREVLGDAIAVKPGPFERVLLVDPRDAARALVVADRGAGLGMTV
jgi:hypothetical protein